MSNGVAGFGDMITFGGTKQVRRLINYEVNGDMNDVVNPCSKAYLAGAGAGLVAGLFTGETEAQVVYRGVRAVRLRYVSDVADIPALAHSAEEAVGMRRDLKAAARARTAWPARKAAELFSQARYGDPLGPTFEQLLDEKGSAERVIAGAGRTNRTINRIFQINGF